MSYRALILTLALAGCGSTEMPSLTTSVRIDALLEDDAHSLHVFAYGPQRSDGIQLTCPSLTDQFLDPTDKRLEQLGRVDITFSQPSATLKDIPEGEGRIVYVEVDDADDTLIGSGCAHGITVEDGETVSVTVDVYPI